MIKNIKKMIKANVISSVTKEDEFDPEVYSDEQYKDRDKNIYDRYGEVIFELFKPIDFMDIGCANGYVADFLLSNSVDSFGVEGADAAFRHMPATIKPRIHKLDLRNDWTEYFYTKVKRKYEVVNFTEVAEHLKPKYEDIMINNIKMMTGKILVMSWSDEWCPYKGTEKQEHFNPKPKKYVINKLKKFGFDFHEQITSEFNSRLNRLDVYDHWKNTILIFKT